VEDIIHQLNDAQATAQPTSTVDMTALEEKIEAVEKNFMQR
jgi:hypothetical protein